MKNKIGYLTASSIVLGAVLMSGTAFAADVKGLGGNHGRGVFGTVSAVNGDIITITSKGFGKNASQTTYTIDATNAKITKDGSASSVGSVAVGDTVMAQGTVSGTNVTATMLRDGVLGKKGNEKGSMRPVVIGTVASVSGNTFTVTSKMGPAGKNATYTVDAANATVTKAGTSSSVSNITTGDMIIVQGTVSGTNVTATTIHDNQTPRTEKDGISALKGNGQPVIGGNVAAVNGTALTITNKSNITYTVDARNATIQKGNTTSSVSAITIGDNVVVQGAVNGTSVTASSIIDSTQTASTNSKGGIKGFIGGIGGFFHSLFGFF